MVSISITDTGIGINQKDLEKIWDEFYIGGPARGDPLSKGLGLPMVKRVVKLHHGTVHCQHGVFKGNNLYRKITEGEQVRLGYSSKKR